MTLSARQPPSPPPPPHHHHRCPPPPTCSYGFLWRLLREAARLWPDPYIHLGGDEVDTACWQVRRGWAGLGLGLGLRGWGAMRALAGDEQQLVCPL